MSQQTGVDWRYQAADDWLSYVKLIVSDKADATFSQAHFTGYLALYHGHHVLVGASDKTEWLLVGKKGQDFQVVGKSVCLMSPPEMGNLIFTSMKQFENPMRAPHVLSFDRWDELLPGVSANRCAYSVVPARMVSATGSGLNVKPLARVPGPAITASNRLREKMIGELRDALMSTAGRAATKAIRAKYIASKNFVVPGSVQPYLLTASMLVEGYLAPMQRMDKAFKIVSARAQRTTSIGTDANEKWISQVDPMLVAEVRTVQELANHPTVRAAVQAQNAKRLSLDRIKELDKQWSSTKELTPFKLSQQKSKVGTLLTQSVLLNPSYTELFVTDDQGANVGAYPATSDYWQGDEDKFTESFVGGGRVFVGKKKYDESTKKVALQVSVPVYDEQKKVVGVLVAGLVGDYLRWKQQQVATTNTSQTAAKLKP